MTPYYIKRMIIEEGMLIVFVGDMNKESFEAQFEIEAPRLMSNTAQIKIEDGE